MITMAMGNNCEIQLFKIDTLGRDIVREDLSIIPCIEQDALTVVLDERREPQSFFMLEVLPKAS